MDLLFYLKFFFKLELNGIVIVFSFILFLFFKLVDDD